MFFRNQNLSVQTFVSFAKHFGDPTIYPFIKGLDDTPEVIEIIKTKVDNPKFFIFSNDTSNLENFFDKHSFDIIHHDNYKAINDFYLSTLCKHFIVGPSTFHWWSAYLGSNSNKLCIAPPEQIKFSSNKDIFPEEWISIY